MELKYNLKFNSKKLFFMMDLKYNLEFNNTKLFFNGT